MHQALAVLSAYVTWQHLPSKSPFPRVYIYIVAGVFLATLIWQCGIVIYRSRARGRGYCRAFITTLDEDESHNSKEEVVKIRLALSRKLKVKAGQSINLWIPSVSFWSFMQSHPFMVTSWAEGHQDTLELFIEPRRGLTRELLRCGKYDMKINRSRLALFSGPHGISAPVCAYESVIMIATGFGIAAQLPYLKELIHGYNNCKARTRRVHLVWQLQSIGNVNPILAWQSD
jgi:predicted ferric reductase